MPLKKLRKRADDIFDAECDSLKFLPQKENPLSFFGRECQINPELNLHFQVSFGRVSQASATDYILILDSPELGFDELGPPSLVFVSHTGGSDDHNMRQSMFICVGESMEKPERIILRRVVPIRLVLFNKLLCCDRERTDLSPSDLSGEIAARFKNWEFSGSGGIICSEQSQLPSQMIQHRSEMTEDLSSEQSDSKRKFFKLLCSIGVGSFLGIELGHEFIRFTTKEVDGFCIKSFKMLSGSTKLRLYVSQLIRIRNHAT